MADQEFLQKVKERLDELESLVDDQSVDGTLFLERKARPFQLGDHLGYIEFDDGSRFDLTLSSLPAEEEDDDEGDTEFQAPGMDDDDDPF